MESQLSIAKGNKHDGTHIDDRILQHRAINRSVVDGDLLLTKGAATKVVEGPARSLLVVHQLGAVVALVEEFEHCREALGLFCDEVDAFGRTLEELRSAGLREKRGFAEDVLVSRKQPLGGADADGHYGRVQIAVPSQLGRLEESKGRCSRRSRTPCGRW